MIYPWKVCCIPIKPCLNSVSSSNTHKANYTFSTPGEEQNYEELAPGASYDPNYGDSRSQRHHEDSRLRRLSRDLTLHRNQKADEVAAEYGRAPDHAMRVRRKSRGKTETESDFKREPRMREMPLADACPIHVDEDDQDEEFDNEDKAGIGLTPRHDSRSQRVIYGKRPSQRLDSSTYSLRSCCTKG